MVRAASGKLRPGCSWPWAWEHFSSSSYPILKLRWPFLHIQSTWLQANGGLGGASGVLTQFRSNLALSLLVAAQLTRERECSNIIISIKYNILYLYQSTIQSVTYCYTWRLFIDIELCLQFTVTWNIRFKTNACNTIHFGKKKFLCKVGKDRLKEAKVIICK